jgi:hypothetical protein
MKKFAEWLHLKEDWAGKSPEKCDICHGDIKDHFVDGKTKMGPWANMCEKCHRQHGVGLGEGKGQKYDKTGKKVEG